MILLNCIRTALVLLSVSVCGFPTLAKPTSRDVDFSIIDSIGSGTTPTQQNEALSKHWGDADADDEYVRSTEVDTHTKSFDGIDTSSEPPSTQAHGGLHSSEIAHEPASGEETESTTNDNGKSIM